MIILIVFSGSVLAQPDRGKNDRMLDMMAAEVGLDDSQIEQVKAILTSRFEAAREDRGIKWEDDNTRMRIARHRMHITDSIIESILTEDQKSRYRAFLRDRREQALSKDILAMAEYLNLTDEQATRLGAILFEFDQSDPMKLEGEKPAAVDPMAMREQQDERLDKLNEQIEEILTPEQMLKYEQFKEEQRNKMGNPGEFEGR